jgi:hypothetical protein
VIDKGPTLIYGGSTALVTVVSRSPISKLS